MRCCTNVRRVVQVALLLLMCLLLPACKKSKVDKANYEKIQVGMTLDDVEDILGKGTKEEGGDGSNVAAQFGIDVHVGGGGGGRGGDTYVWERGDSFIKVFFHNGKVTNKTSKDL
jgi:hypothetical protein